jgi:hypothetical protein
LKNIHKNKLSTYLYNVLSLKILLKVGLLRNEHLRYTYTSYITTTITLLSVRMYSTSVLSKVLSYLRMRGRISFRKPVCDLVGPRTHTRTVNSDPFRLPDKSNLSNVCLAKITFSSRITTYCALYGSTSGSSFVRK